PRGRGGTVSIGIVYIGLLLLGLVYAVIAGALGWFSDIAGHFHFDAGGHIGHVDAGHSHPVSGTTVATFITGFGAGGVLGHYVFEWPLVGGLTLAAAGGLVLAAAAYGVLELIFSQTQAGSEYAAGDLVGREAEVITAIPE